MARDKRGMGGTAPDIGIYMRSRWEMNVCRYLKLQKEIGLIKDWAYENNTFEFPVKRGTRFYTPDFQVWRVQDDIEPFEALGVPVSPFYFIEVKGYMDAHSKTQLARMAKYYPNVKIYVIEKPEYTVIKTSYAHQIPEWED